MKKVHFIGIGGIGISALALYYFSKGWEVSGSDVAESDVTENLKKKGIDINIGHNKEYLKDDTERVIYSVAVKEDNPEIQKAKDLSIKISTYAQALAELTKENFTIAISGSHGKGSTTAMLALIMIEAGLDPTVIIGTRLKEFGGTNFREGKNKYLLIEADEYDRSFLNYSPEIAVITNIDAEHLDIFKNLEGVIETFNKYIKNLKEDSKLILNKSDANSEKAKEGYKGEVVYLEGGNKWNLQVPGEFNQLNAEAAWQVGKILGVDKVIAEKALEKYKGAWRRMEELESKVGYKGAIFFADYGHHPTEIKATTKAVKEEYPNKKLLLIFQPHQAKRLAALFEDFTTAFSHADELVLLPTYEVVGREAEITKTCKDLYKEIEKRNESNKSNQKAYYLQSLDEALKLIQEQVVIFMGAGNIDSEVRKHFKSKLL